MLCLILSHRRQSPLILPSGSPKGMAVCRHQQFLLSLKQNPRLVPEFLQNVWAHNYCEAHKDLCKSSSNHVVCDSYHPWLVCSKTKNLTHNESTMIMTGCGMCLFCIHSYQQINTFDSMYSGVNTLLYLAACIIDACFTFM